MKEQRKHAGMFGALKSLNIMQWMACCMAMIILVSTVATTVVYANHKGNLKEMRQLAAEQAEAEKIAAEQALLEEADLPEEIKEMQPEEDPVEVEEVEEATEKVELALILTSVSRDLKIKIVDQSEALVSGVNWIVSVMDSKSKGKEYTDDDSDGIIYIKDIATGNYIVTLEKKNADEAVYVWPEENQKVAVKDKVEYKVVKDIKDEIKKENQVNTATEDTSNAAKEPDAGAVIKDTIETVESSKTPVAPGTQGSITDTLGIAYEQVDPSTVNVDVVPFTTAKKNTWLSDVKTLCMSGIAPMRFMNFLASSITLLDGSELKLTVSAEAGTVNIGKEIKVKADVTAGVTATWTQSGTGSVDIIGSGNEITVKGKTEGTVTVTAKASKSVSANTVQEITHSCSITVAGNAPIKPTGVVLSGASTVRVGKTTTLKATLSPVGAVGTIVFSSSDPSIAAVEPEKGVIAGLKVGEVTITAAVKDTDIKATQKVTVTVQRDRATLINDKSGNELYVKSGTKYIRATYGDYEDKKILFKIKTDSGAYKYTGWQTIGANTYYFNKDGVPITGEQIIGGVKYNFATDGALVKGSASFGIDVSRWNGSINWPAVKAAGVNYAIIRCGYRGTSTGALIEDSKWKANIAGAKAAGLKVGVYFFTQAVNEVEAIEEASMVAALCQGYGIDYPVFIDVEGGARADGLSVEARTSIIQAFCKTIQSVGYTPGVYANTSWFNSKINASQLGAYKIWLAQYNTAGPTYKGRYDLWQYTSKGAVNGIKGNVDFNQSYLGY